LHSFPPTTLFRSVAALAQVAHHRAPGRALARAAADHRHAGRLEDRRESVGAHGGTVSIAAHGPWMTQRLLQPGPGHRRLPERYERAGWTGRDRPVRIRDRDETPSRTKARCA